MGLREGGWVGQNPMGGSPITKQSPVRHPAEPNRQWQGPGGEGALTTGHPVVKPLTRGPLSGEGRGWLAMQRSQMGDTKFLKK